MLCHFKRQILFLFFFNYTFKLMFNLARFSTRSICSTSSHWCIIYPNSAWESWWWRAVLSGFLRPVSNHFRVDCTRHAVMELGVQFRQCICFVNTGISDISHCRCFHNVANDELLDGLIFWYTSGTVCTTNRVNVPSTVLTTAIISPFTSHFMKICSKQ